MSGGLANINLLGLVLAIKSQRRNSLLYAHEKNYILAAKFGMAPATFKKYMAELSHLGLVEEANGHRRVISLSTCINVLLGHLFSEEQQGQIKHVRFFRNETKENKVKVFAARIRFALAKLNYEQQQYCIDQTDFLDSTTTDRFNVRQVRNYKTALKKHGCNSLQKLSSTVKRITKVVSGKTHVSRLLGCSDSTGLRMLRLWHRTGLIKRTVIKKFLPSFVCFASYDSMKEQGYKYIRPVSKGFIAYLGSEIEVRRTM